MVLKEKSTSLTFHFLDQLSRVDNHEQMHQRMLDLVCELNDNTIRLNNFVTNLLGGIPMPLTL